MRKHNDGMARLAARPPGFKQGVNLSIGLLRNGPGSGQLPRADLIFLLSPPTQQYLIAFSHFSFQRVRASFIRPVEASLPLCMERSTFRHDARIEDAQLGMDTDLRQELRSYRQHARPALLLSLSKSVVDCYELDRQEKKRKHVEFYKIT